MRTSVIIASADRPELLEQTLAHIVECFKNNAEIVLSVPDESSIPKNLHRSVTLTFGARGLCAQRNAGIKVAQSDSEFFVFFDDDAVPAGDYVYEVEKYFDRNPEVYGLTGLVLRDGGVNFGEAVNLLDERLPGSRSQGSRSLYGCNFAVRAESAKKLGFDERLPLYSWLEDLDFARRLLRIGQLSKISTAQCVHLAHQSGGREKHKRFGFSQMMNPSYLLQKKSINLWEFCRLTSKPLAANIIGSLHISMRGKWRRERLAGNLIALWDIMRGRISPERAAYF